ncbi:MAG: NAD(P)H-binding protein [Anaerolineaceae bacterium]|nr:NAD(P)H-binding protein [Anaerolineaceae bacterium]
MSDNGKPTLLVTGASGKLGQRVLELLLEANAGTIVGATRTPEKLAAFAEKGVIVRQADFHDGASLIKAFEGVDRLLLISTDTIGNRLDQQIAAVKAAEAAGVKHVVYTSIANVQENSTAQAGPDHYGTEQALIASKMGYTFLRNSIYTDMFLVTLGQAIASGTLYAASGDGKIGYITREDCARAAAAALTDGFEGRRALDITGPEALSQYDIAEIASAVSGKPVTYVPLTLEALIKGMVGAGLPQPIAEMIASFDAATAKGELEVVTNAFEELTGRKPVSVADFLAANKEALTQPAAAH